VADTTRSTVRAETKVCSLCGETKPAGAFEQGRRQCRDCRRDAVKRRARERRAAPADGEEPHPAPRQVREGRPGEHRRMTDQFFREHRRALIEEARASGVTRELRDGKVYTVLHLEPQFGLPNVSP